VDAERSSGQSQRAFVRTLRVATLGLLCGGLAGCGDGPRTVPVAGAVIFDGQPLTTGTVQFHPVEPTNKHQPVGTIGADGKYQVVTDSVPGAPVGKYKIVVNASAPSNPSDPYSLPKSLIPQKYNVPEETELLLEVASGAVPGAYDLQLSK
jgi:hypothetical protein